MRKLILTDFVVLLAAAIVATTMIMTLLTYSIFENRVIDDLSMDARVIAAMMENGEALKVLAEIKDALRVTIVLPSGEVVYDNRVDTAGMDNHAHRREIKLAMENGEGYDVRESETLDRNTFYYAMRLTDGSVLRAAKEASSIWNIYLRAAPLIVLIAVLLIALSAGATNALTRRVVEPIRRMTEKTDAEKEIKVYPELAPLLSKIHSQHEEIIRSADMRAEFTANVSHELKTPLTSITGYAELIESGMAEGEMIKRFAGEIHKNASRLLTLINDTIRLSQMDEDRNVIEREIMDPAVIAENVAEQLRMSAEKHWVTLSVDAKPCLISADRRMIEELIHNLCDNAIRYNVRGGSVRLTVRPIKEHVLVMVQDTGIGISREHQERVFERFYRVDKSRSKATGGTGLGLAIVKHIAARHDAKITMKSELGRGTTIMVKFDRVS